MSAAAKPAPTLNEVIERLTLAAYREGYMAGNEVSVRYEYENRVAHAEGRAARYYDERRERVEREFAACDSHDALVAALESTNHALREASGRLGWAAEHHAICPAVKAMLTAYAKHAWDAQIQPDAALAKPIEQPLDERGNPVKS